MGNALSPYVIRQGDHLLRVAFRCGVDADAVWGNAKNASLSGLRDSYHVLLAGDVVYLPEPRCDWIPLQVGATNELRASVPACTVQHTFIHDGAPLANATYRALGACDASPHQTDGDGLAKFDVLVTTTVVRVVFDSGRIYELWVGHLDPADSPSGCEQRLVHLGYLCRACPGDGDRVAKKYREAARRFALAALQRDNGISPSDGQLDAATVAKLTELHGC